MYILCFMYDFYLYMAGYSFHFLLVFFTSIVMNVVSSQNGRSSLMVASHYGHVEVVDKLLKCRAKVDLQTQVITLLIYLYILLHLVCGFHTTE